MISAVNLYVQCHAPLASTAGGACSEGKMISAVDVYIGR